MTRLRAKTIGYRPQFSHWCITSFDILFETHQYFSIALASRRINDLNLHSLFFFLGSSSFESQKMGPSISVTSPMSPGMHRDNPQYLSGQLSVSTSICAQLTDI